MNLEDLASNYTQHTVKAGQPSGLNKTGRNFGSVIHHNLLPINDLFRFIPPLLHIIMGCGNDTFIKLKSDVIQLDVDETGVVNDYKYIEKITNSLKNLYEQKETLESEFNDIQLAHMISINDFSRIKLIKEGNIEEAEIKAYANYKHHSKEVQKNERNCCDAESCVIFSCDEEAELDEDFICHNGCRIHLRCEGKIFTNEYIPVEYKCEQCKTGFGNTA